MDDLPDGYEEVPDEILDSRAMMPYLNHYLTLAEMRIDDAIIVKNNESQKYHRVIDIPRDRYPKTLVFREDIGPVLGNRSLYLDDIIENPIRFTLFVNPRALSPWMVRERAKRDLGAAGGPVASSGHAMTSSMVV